MRMKVRLILNSLKGLIFMTAFVDSLTSHVSTLSLEILGHVPAHPFFWTMLSNGSADVHECIIFFGLESGKSAPSLVAKIPRLPEDDWVIKAEYDRLVEICNLVGMPDAVQYLPQPISYTSLNGQPVLITTYVHGENLLRTFGKMIQRRPDMVYTLALDVAKSLRFIMDRTAQLVTINGRPESDFHKKVEKFKQMHSLTENEIQVADNLVEEIEHNNLQASHQILLQGDFWHGNMIRGEKYGKLIIIDWQYSRWSTDASLDVYLFLLAASLATAPRTDVRERASKAVETLNLWRSQMIPAYLAVFGKTEHYSLLPLRSGMLMCCIEKAVRASMDLGYDQENDLVWRFLYAELLNWAE